MAKTVYANSERYFYYLMNNIKSKTQFLTQLFNLALKNLFRNV